MREITFAQAILEATDQVMEADSSVILMGEGVPDPTAVFGTTIGLQEKFGKHRVFDCPISENGFTGVAIGASLIGAKPIVTHQRMDFTLYAMDQIVNNAAKWKSMFGGHKSVPMVMRVVIGRGWGQGNQHSQNLQAFFCHTPGLIVVSPSSASAAKGLLISAVKNPDPVIFIEHRWLHGTTSHVPEEMYELPLGKAKVLKHGKDLTIVTWSYMTREVELAVNYLNKNDIYPEVIDLQTLSPIDYQTICLSVRDTGRLMVVDDSWRSCGLAGEIVAEVCERLPVTSCTRMTNPDKYCPSSSFKSKGYYVTASDIYSGVMAMLDKDEDYLLDELMSYERTMPHDVPNKDFRGPF